MGPLEHARRFAPYLTLAAMTAVSTVLMFGLMYFNTYALDHIWFSQTRAWMALVMGMAMVPVMMLFMRRMYPDRRANTVVLAGAAGVFALSLFMVRSQALVGDVAYMKAMIPHHSIAVLTSRRAHIHDPRVRALADRILEAQLREIEEMRDLVIDLERRPLPAAAPGVPPAA